MLSKYKNDLKNKGEVYLRVKVFPGASKTMVKDFKIDNIDDKDVETIMLSIKSPAEKNKANLDLINFFSKEFGVLKNNVLIISGGKGRIKLLKILLI
ncbi:hypothetical protein CVU82_00480 [Candidatus Falkowbacteria bacterium HGW-Falkowbacteria-1]|uniref:UPF0235 protein CVU82_00480 n=1 Tax=Candidatus Falkowbacteria bacterium HGW-Falkowbacteria-1 TaxID=2013768 RepID=A0A2N2EAA5_9BACT|nr:MAG: hypothetical protein CVU82_00480 [Candidatus Falkowbacteria bacterium HGW-Falkowbacteria-1]